MLEWPMPTVVMELHGFLGLTGYNRKFVKNYGIITLSLSNMLKKKAFLWDDAASMAFAALK
jgi:hypothetical protein